MALSSIWPFRASGPSGHDFHNFDRRFRDYYKHAFRFFFEICIGVENIFKALNAFSLKGHIGPHFRAQTPKPGSMNFIIHEEGFMYIMFMHTDFLTIVGVEKIFKD